MTEKLDASDLPTLVKLHTLFTRAANGEPSPRTGKNPNFRTRASASAMTTMLSQLITHVTAEGMKNRDDT